ncbi:hypothetical protein AAFN85_13375 [Mucilaginibacter sp. CAU 1740]|uniref:hypothetical protein n=1 Tax=Mucilaginibacter sp. CAU 1740 TaxID=3140365 RepID=UPI00325A5DE0
MELLLSIAQHMHDLVRERFTKDIIARELSVPTSENKFWNIKFEDQLLFHLLIGDFEPVFLRDKVKYKSDRRFTVQNKTVLNFALPENLAAYLRYLEIPGADLPELFDNFLNTLDKDDKEFQLRFLNQDGSLRKSKSKPLADIEQLLEDKARLLSRLYSPRLLGEKFWFYFYGYEKFKGIQDVSKTWPLVKLLFTFVEMSGIDMAVSIDNTSDTEHHDYVGKTDFLTSREEVLVINCRTYPDFFRQLNIKIHIGTCDGNIFLGQYMNYESEGRIISGSVLMQKITKSEVLLTPKVHHIPKLKPDEKMFSEDFEGIDKNILQYLHDKKLNFRRTSLRAGHNLATLEKWLKHHHSK